MYINYHYIFKFVNIHKSTCMPSHIENLSDRDWYDLKHFFQKSKNTASIVSKTPRELKKCFSCLMNFSSFYRRILGNSADFRGISSLDSSGCVRVFHYRNGILMCVHKNFENENVLVAQLLEYPSNVKKIMHQ